jgi:hydrogenase/urease accessory protein HupE
VIARALLSLVVCLALGERSLVRAHESRPAYLELRQTGPESYEILWKVPARGDMRLALYPRFPAGSSFAAEPVCFQTGDAYLERSTLLRPGGLDGQRIAIEGLAGTMTDALVRIVHADGSTQTLRVSPAEPSFEVAAEPSTLQSAFSFLKVGFEHILLGADHLLFVLGLLLIVRGRQLLWTVTAFTLAHSLTLALATLGLASAPLPPLNAAIALSILFLGPEIVRSWRGESSLTLRRPWLVAFAFGLLHGFGFASGLSTLGLPRAEIALGLLSFNVGVELGQLGFVLLVLALVRAFRVLELRWPAWVARAPGYAVGVCGAYWTIQRTVLLVSGS